MRMSREAMDEHHRAIVAGGARMLRERGIEGVSIAELMQSVGLTHGGFYRHFASKDAFVAEASAHAFAEVAAMRSGAGNTSEPKDQLEAWIEYYLSDQHMTSPGIGCPIAALAQDVHRSSDSVRAVFAEGIDHVLAWMSERLPGNTQARQALAARLLAAMVGAVVTARTSSQPDLILGPAREEARRLIA